MAIINQYDKRSGITYVYESTSYWDKEKQQPRSNRTLIGKRDPVTGEIVPTDGRRKKKHGSEMVVSAKPGPVPITVANRRFYGATYLLDEIGHSLGIGRVTVQLGDQCADARLDPAGEIALLETFSISFIKVFRASLKRCSSMIFSLNSLLIFIFIPPII